ncbi:glycosyltransferase [Bradyrhizobium ottawaense]|uniref:glycosyltransferase n=1 Tax=Bradyrhizobium ottawaense TaxID=931866 RepID=UPI0004265FB2|nr:glycosyltransferase [Bradyrhizobium ottawaense]
MRIWLVNTGEEIPSDTGKPRLLRTGIMAERLALRGHEVTWWNSTVNHQRKEQRASITTIADRPEGYKLVLLYGRLYAKNISLGRIVSQVQNAREFARVALTLPCPDIILCGYPPIELAEAAVRFAISRQIPVAIDFRDMWPDIIADHTSGLTRVAAIPALSYWNRSLRYTVRNATAILGVTDGFVDWALRRGGRPRGPLDRAFHLAINPTPPAQSDIRDAERFWDEMGVAPGGDHTIGCFAGTLSHRLDVKTLVRGAVQLPEAEKQRSRLVICGKGDQDEELRKLGRNERHILFAGWRTAAEIHVLLRRCHYGVLPYFSTADFIVHYPNKVGEYLGAGLPIMTGLTGQVRSLLEMRGLGYFYSEGNEASVAKCLKLISADRSSFATKQQRALEVYKELFDPERIYESFCLHLEHIAATASLQKDVASDHAMAL